MPSVSLSWNQYVGWLDPEDDYLQTPFDPSDYNQFGDDPLLPFDGQDGTSFFGPYDVLSYHGLIGEPINVTGVRLNVTVSSTGSRNDSIDIEADGDLVAQALKNESDVASYSSSSLALPGGGTDLSELQYGIVILALRSSIEANRVNMTLSTFIVTVDYEVLGSEFWTDFIGASEVA